MEIDKNNENYDHYDDNIALMLEHFATMYLDKNKKQLYDKMQLEQQRQHYQVFIPLLLLTPAQLTQPTHSDEKLNDNDHLSYFVLLPYKDLLNYYFKQAWTDGTTAATTQPLFAWVPARAQKKIMILNVDEELDPNKNADSTTISTTAKESNMQGLKI